MALVPGSFATTIMYDKVIPILEKAGYTVHPIELLSANDGSRLPPPKMEDDANEIHQQLLTLLDSGKNVILCVQSYSGIPGSQACKGLSRTERGSGCSAVIGIVYAASYIPDVGESIRSMMDKYIPEEYKAGLPGKYFPAGPPEAAFAAFCDLDDHEEVLRYGRAMTGHSSDTYSGRVTHAAWRLIRGTTIIPEKDGMIAVVEQEKMFERANREGAGIKRVWVEGGGHGITVSRPDVVARELIELAGQ